jgi:general secretion pathway protein C
VDFLFRRHFWIVHVFFIMCTALILAKAVNTYVGFRLSKSFALKPPPPRAMPREEIKPPRDFTAADDRNMFGAKREAIQLENEAEVAADESAANWQDAVKTGLPFRLVSTIVFEDPFYSMAGIEDIKAQTEGDYSINDCVTPQAEKDPELEALLGKESHFHVPCNELGTSAIIRRIEPSRVVFYNQDTKRYEYVALETAGENAFAQPRSSENFAPGPVAAGDAELGTFGDTIRATGPNSFEIAQGDFEATLANLATISTQARAVPAMENGRSIGFKMFAIRQGSVFSKLGLKDGDVIRRINGYDMNSPEQALTLYARLKTARQFNIDIQRDGQNKTLDYSVVGGLP